MEQTATLNRFFGRFQYKNVMLSALIAASAVPVLLCVLKFQITSPQIYAATLLFSVVLAMNNSHTWITLAYFFDKKWLAHFKSNPLIFFAAPAAIASATIGAMLVAPVNLATWIVFAGLIAATWHHAKQNWGIMSLVGKIRDQNVSALRVPLTNGWIFFALAWSVPISGFATDFPADILYKISIAGLVFYAVYCGWLLKRSGLLFSNDGVTLAFAVVLLGYFVPVVIFQGKPYALLLFGFAHSLQYYILVLSSLSLRERKSSSRFKISMGISIFAAAVIGLTLTGYFIISIIENNAAVMWDSLVVRAAIGANLAISLIHFWTDAFVWKLSDKKIRELHGDALAF